MNTETLRPSCWSGLGAPHTVPFGSRYGDSHSIIHEWIKNDMSERATEKTPSRRAAIERSLWRAMCQAVMQRRLESALTPPSERVGAETMVEVEVVQDKNIPGIAERPEPRSFHAATRSMCKKEGTPGHLVSPLTGCLALPAPRRTINTITQLQPHQTTESRVPCFLQQLMFKKNETDFGHFYICDQF